VVVGDIVEEADGVNVAVAVEENDEVGGVVTDIVEVGVSEAVVVEEGETVVVGVVVTVGERVFVGEVVVVAVVVGVAVAAGFKLYPKSIVSITCPCAKDMRVLGFGGVVSVYPSEIRKRSLTCTK